MDNLIGKKLDGLYEVKELIGSGGMANVYKAVMLGRNRIAAWFPRRTPPPSRD